MSTPVFEGPFDLLLHLILSEQVDLYDVSLASIVDKYLAELERMSKLDLEIATEFLLIASTLVDLKARRLLPEDTALDLDEELALFEERDLLLAKLLECQTFKNAADDLSGRIRQTSDCFPRTIGPDDRFLDLAPDLLGSVGPRDLFEAYSAANRPRETEHVETDHIAPIRTSVVDAFNDLTEVMPRVQRSTFRDLTANMVDIFEVIASFLALLELFRQGLVDLKQAESVGMIEVIWRGASGSGDVKKVDAYDG